MPPPITPPVDYGSGGSAFSSLLGAVPVVGGVLNGVSQIFTNARNRKFQVQMYERQRADALSDWERTLPAAQMQRLKEAGLNPNLIYGNGSVAVSSSQPRSSSPGGGTASAPQFDASGMYPMLMFQLKSEMQAQQIENLRTQNLVLQTQIPLNKERLSNLEVDTQQKSFKLALDNTLRENTVLSRDAALRNIGQRNEYLSAATGSSLSHLDVYNKYGAPQAEQSLLNAQQLNVLRDAANARAELTNLADLKIKGQMVLNMAAQFTKTAQETLNIEETRNQIRNAKTLQELDMWMKNMGFNWTDPLMLRQLKAQSAPFSEFKVIRK